MWLPERVKLIIQHLALPTANCLYLSSVYHISYLLHQNPPSFKKQPLRSRVTRCTIQSEQLEKPWHSLFHGSRSNWWEIQVAKKGWVWVFWWVQNSYFVQSRSTDNYTGEIYIARDIFSGRDVAVKLEPMQGAHPTLEHEFHIYKKLAGGTGIPFVHSFCMECGYNVMVMDCLGQSLEELFVNCHFRFSTKTILLLASQLVS